MQVLQLQLMKAIVNLLAPSSPAFGNQFFSNQQPQTNQNTINIALQPGDIIFTRTDTLIYNSSRSFLHIEYDHVAVVINNQQLLHISPPIVSRLPIKSLVNKTRSPIIIRPQFKSQSQKQLFLKHLLDLLGTKYSMSAIPMMFLNQILAKINLPQSYQFNLNQLKQSRICSDAVLYALCSVSQQFKTFFQQWVQTEQSQYKKVGFILPDDLLNSLKKKYPIIYQQQQPSSGQQQHKPMLDLAQQKILQLIKSTKQNTTSYLIGAKLLAMLRSNIKLGSQAKILKKLMFNNLKMISIAMLVCDIFGIGVNTADYSRKVMMLTSLMTILGAGLWAGQHEKKYQLPDPQKIQKLSLKQIKPKL